jgi:hypothetical protein
MMHCLYERGWAHHNDQQLNITPWPQSTKDILAWEDHFHQTVQKDIDGIRTIYGGINTSFLDMYI